MKELTEMEPRTVALLTSIAIGLGIVVHGVFFVVALLIAGVAVGRVLYDYYKLTHHHP